MTQVFMTEKIPKALIVAHGSPTAPRFPNVRNSAVDEPIRVLKAAISSKPLPMPGDEEENRPVGGDLLPGAKEEGFASSAAAAKRELALKLRSDKARCPIAN